MDVRPRASSSRPNHVEQRRQPVERSLTRPMRVSVGADDADRGVNPARVAADRHSSSAVKLPHLRQNLSTGFHVDHARRLEGICRSEMR